jgi:exocyst complex component 2
VEELDKSLFNGYVKPRAEVIANKIYEAILGGHIDWYRVPQPKGNNNFVYPGKAETEWKPTYPAICPYVHKILNCLVEVYGQVCSVAQSHLDRTLSALLDGLAEEAQTAFGKVKRFGTGGLLQVCPILISFFSNF